MSGIVRETDLVFDLTDSVCERPATWNNEQRRRATGGIECRQHFVQAPGLREQAAADFYDRGDWQSENG
jgi:hypothetical protein